MVEKLVLKEFSIGTHHTISVAPFESLRIEASITCGCRIGCTDQEFRETLALAEARLREILEETYRNQKRRTEPQSNATSQRTEPEN